MEEEIYSSLLLNSVSELSPEEYRILVLSCGGASALLKMGFKNWGQFIDISNDRWDKIGHEIETVKKTTDGALRKIKDEKIQVLLSHQGAYPERLRHIYHPPAILFVKGQNVCIDVPVIAIVGSRRCTHYGEKVASRLAEELSEMGIVTVSGLARGIDTHVHWASVKKHRPTWAVIGSGLSRIYPPENKKLSEEIMSDGAIVSEFPMDTIPHPSNFPRRNRIIAGLSLGTVVVEGSEKSGALITARLAAEEGRDVFAVPGPVTSRLSAAPHRLLRLGAKMVESATDIVEEFSRSDKNKIFQPPFASEKGAQVIGAQEKGILSYLGSEPISKECLAEKWVEAKESLPQRLLELELKGLIKSLPGGLVVKI